MFKKFTTLALASIFFAFFLSASDSYAQSDLIEFESYPDDVVLEYPNGTDLTVVVKNADKVDHIEWNVSDGEELFTVQSEDRIEDNKFISTVHLYSTSRANFPLYFEPFVYDINGDSIFEMDDIDVTLSNQTEKKPVIYVGEYAIQPGQSLDISTTGYGSGLISFAENATDVTFKNFNLEVQPKTFDWIDQTSHGVLLDYGVYHFDGDPAEDEHYWEDREAHLNSLPYDYNFIFEGENKITGSYVTDGDVHDGSWYGIQTFFSSRDLETYPTVHFKGSGSLTVEGGLYGIYINGGNADFDINTTVTRYENAEYYSTAIDARDIILKSGKSFNLEANGPTLYSRKDIEIQDGVKLTTLSEPQRAGNGYSFMSNVYAANILTISGAELNLTGVVDEDRFAPFYNRLSTFNALAGSDGITVKDSAITITTTVDQSDTPFAANIHGIRCAGEDEINIQNSKVNISIDAPTSTNSVGLFSLGSIKISDNSDIKTNTNARGMSLGISATESLEITDSNVEANATTDDEEAEIASIASENIIIDLTKKGYTVSATANRSAAIAAPHGNTIHDGDLPAYADGYNASKITLKNLAQTIRPTPNEINQFAYLNYMGNYYAAETFYDTNNTSAPALDVVISSGEENPETSDNIRNSIICVTVIIIASTTAVATSRRRVY